MKRRWGLVCAVGGVALAVLTAGATAYTRLNGPFGVNEDQHPFKNNALLAGDEARTVALSGTVLCVVLSLAGVLIDRARGFRSTSVRVGMAGLLIAGGVLIWTAVTWVQDGISYMLAF